jgi:hypothetical protein
MISSISKKQIRSSEKSCCCVMSTKWREILTQANLIKNIRSVEHLLKEFYYLERQVCERHINELERTVRLIISEESQRNEEYSLTIIEEFENDEDF